jgi:hypothetical protein
MKPALLTLINQIEKKLDKQRPSPGRHVQISKGNHKGKTGIVLQHAKDEHDFTMLISRIENNETQRVKELRGREGYLILFKDDSTNNTFWIKASYVTCDDEMSK